jgi:hypothetical protein
MIIALDYDDTYTEDPEGWDAVVNLLESRGHEFICVTMRYESEPIEIGVDCVIYYTGRRAKITWLKENGVPPPDIWIDDCPHFLFTDSK